MPSCSRCNSRLEVNVEHGKFRGPVRKSENSEDTSMSEEAKAGLTDEVAIVSSGKK